MQKFVLSLMLFVLVAHKLTDAYSARIQYFEQDKVEVQKDDLALKFFSQSVMEAEKLMADPALPELLKSLGLTTLVELVGKAGLGPTLSGAGPFTVFGPTNQAFDNLPEWAKKLVSNTTILTYVLEYHVLPQVVPSSALKDEQLVDSVLKGKQIRINIYTKTGNAVPTITAQCAPIDLSQVDKKASNGLAHVLNGVMIPPVGNIVETVVACPAFKTLVTAVKVGGLVEALSGAGPFTLFAPTDTAFKKLPPGALDKLLKNKTALQRVLKYHVVNLTYCSHGLATGLYGQITTLAGQNVTIDVSAGGVKVNEANVISADGSVSNGVVHAIDTVLFPPNFDMDL